MAEELYDWECPYGCPVSVHSDFEHVILFILEHCKKSHPEDIQKLISELGIVVD